MLTTLNRNMQIHVLSALFVQGLTTVTLCPDTCNSPVGIKEGKTIQWQGRNPDWYLYMYCKKLFILSLFDIGRSM